MGLKIASNVGKAIMIVINIVFLAMGLACLIVGIIMQTNNKVLGEEEIVDTLNQVELSPGLQFGNIASALSLCVIFVGAFAIVLSILGLLGAGLTSKPILIIYVIVVGVLFVGGLVLLVLWIVHKEKVESRVLEELTDALGLYDGISSTDGTSNGWDNIFIDYDCCGANAVSASNDQEFSNSKWWANRGSDKVPTSCCKGTNRKNYKSYTNTACTASLTEHRTKGCYEALKDNEFKYQTAAIVIGSVLQFLELLGVAFGIVMIVAI